MANKIDINSYIGQKFGKLTITKIWRDNVRREIKCMARCDDCQQEKEYRFRNLRDGVTKSCGCLHKIILEDLPGQKFNRLTILEAKREQRGGDSHSQVYVKCKCDCGNIMECRLSSLKNNAIQSCGCLHKEIIANASTTINLDDLVGQQYGKLTILSAERKKKNNDKNQRIYVQAKCECGTVKEYLFQALKQGETKSCGCLNSSHTKIDLNDLIGKKYGKLTILKAYRNQRSEIRCSVQCECGNQKDVRYRNLVSGETKSCGKCQLINLDELPGKKYGKLTIISAKRRDDNSKKNEIYVKAKCDCNGNIKEYRYHCLANGHTKSCGCNIKTANGNSIKRLYKIWRNMQDRCYNEKNIRYEHYGKKGIIVCDEWRNSYEVFETWALANGYSDDLSIDRINNDGNYCPENCRWATVVEQANNKSINRYIEINGETKTLAQWCRQYHIKPSLVRIRVDILKWDIIKALSIPPKESEAKIVSPRARLRGIWSKMLKRCFDSASYQYPRYGGRGIKVCNEWKDNFQAFYDWAVNNGYQNDLSIDRVDNNGNYEPSNCRWITSKEQNNNRENSIFITKDGKTQSLAQWCEELNLNYSKIYARITTLKWDPLKALVE